MMATDKAAIFAVTFTVACAALYTVCTELNLPLLTYHPVIGEIDLLWTPERSGPAMYWYGWMLSALVGAAALAFIASLAPEAWVQRAIAFASVAAAAYLVAYSLSLVVYDKATIELEILKSRWPSLIAAVAIAALAVACMPEAWHRRLWPGWAWLVPAGALTVLGYYLVPYFTR